MRALFLVLLLATAADARVIQPWQGGTGCSSPKTIAALPGSPAAGDFCTVTDGASAADCTTGGGSEVLICLYDGSAWTPIGGAVTDIWVDEAGDAMTGQLTIDVTGSVPLVVTDTDNTVTGQLMSFVASGQSPPQVGDGGYISFRAEDSTDVVDDVCRLGWRWNDETAGTGDGEFYLGCDQNSGTTELLSGGFDGATDGHLTINPAAADVNFIVMDVGSNETFRCEGDGTGICSFASVPTVGPVSFTDIYVNQSGDTMTGTLNGTDVSMTGDVAATTFTAGGTDIADIYVDEAGDAMTGTLDIDTTSANALQVYSSTGANANYAQMGCEGNGSPNTLCNLSLTGDNDAGNETIYVQLRHQMVDLTAASIDGKFEVLVKQNGDLRSMQNWTSSSGGVLTSIVNPSNLDLDFRVDGTTDGLISTNAGNDSVDFGAVTTVSGANEQHTLAVTETGSTAIADRDWLKSDITVSPGATATGTQNVAIMGMITNDTTQNVGTVQAGEFQTLISAANGGGARGLQGRLEVSGSAALGSYEGLQFNTIWGSTANSTLGGYSAFNNFGWSSTGNIGVASAAVVTYNRFDLQNNTGTRSTNNVRIGEFDMHRFASATNTTISNMVGVYIDGDWGGPNITSAYQLYLTNPDSGPTNTYAIYQLDNSNNATNLLDSATTFGDITHHNTKGIAPASCSIGDLYVDNSGGFCACTAANTWTNISGVGNCT